jgi:hypothetical protein
MLLNHRSAGTAADPPHGYGRGTSRRAGHPGGRRRAGEKARAGSADRPQARDRDDRTRTNPRRARPCRRHHFGGCPPPVAQAHDADRKDAQIWSSAAGRLKTTPPVSAPLNSAPVAPHPRRRLSPLIATARAAAGAEPFLTDR